MTSYLRMIFPQPKIPEGPIGYATLEIVSNPTIVEKIPDAIIADIKALKAASDQLAKDADI